MQTAPEIPRPFARAGSRYPIKVTLMIETTPPRIKL